MIKEYDLKSFSQKKKTLQIIVDINFLKLINVNECY